MLFIRSIVLFTLLCPLGSINAEPPADQSTENETKYQLQYKFVAGESRHYRLSEQSEFHSISPRENSRATNDSFIEKHYKVKDVRDDGSAVIELVFDRIKIKYDLPQIGKVEYDSAKDAVPPEQFASLKRKVGKPIAEAVVKPTGEIQSLVKQGARNPRANPLEESKEKQNFLVILPSDPIAVGESWNFRYKVNMPLTARVTKEFEIRYVYTLEEIEDDLAEISFTTFVSPRLVDPLLRGKFMQYLPSGTVKFDLAKGQLLSQEQHVQKTEVNVGGQRTALTIDLKRQEKLVEPNQREVSQAKP